MWCALSLTGDPEDNNPFNAKRKKVVGLNAGIPPKRPPLPADEFLEALEKYIKSKRRKRHDSDVQLVPIRYPPGSNPPQVPSTHRLFV